MTKISVVIPYRFDGARGETIGEKESPKFDFGDK